MEPVTSDDGKVSIHDKKGRVKAGKLGKRLVWGLVLCASIYGVRRAYPRVSAFLGRSSLVDITLENGLKNGACKPEFPLLLTVRNGSAYEVQSVTFYPNVTRPGHSNNQVPFEEMTDDTIVPVGESRSTCWSVRTYNGQTVQADWVVSVNQNMASAHFW